MQIDQKLTKLQPWLGWHPFFDSRCRQLFHAKVSYCEDVGLWPPKLIFTKGNAMASWTYSLRDSKFQVCGILHFAFMFLICSSCHVSETYETLIEESEVVQPRVYWAPMMGTNSLKLRRNYFSTKSSFNYFLTTVLQLSSTVNYHKSS